MLYTKQCYDNNMGDKKLIRCSVCKNTFFTKKLNYTKNEINEKLSSLNAQLKAQLQKLDNLELSRSEIDKSIDAQKELIHNTQQKIDTLKVTVQCSNCGKRLIAIENEVKT